MWIWLGLALAGAQDWNGWLEGGLRLGDGLDLVVLDERPDAPDSTTWIRVTEEEIRLGGYGPDAGTICPYEPWDVCDPGQVARFVGDSDPVLVVEAGVPIEQLQPVFAGIEQAGRTDVHVIFGVETPGPRVRDETFAAELPEGADLPRIGRRMAEELRERCPDLPTSTDMRDIPELVEEIDAICPGATDVLETGLAVAFQDMVLVTYRTIALGEGRRVRGREGWTWTRLSKKLIKARGPVSIELPDPSPPQVPDPTLDAAWLERFEGQCTSSVAPELRGSVSMEVGEPVSKPPLLHVTADGGTIERQSGVCGKDLARAIARAGSPLSLMVDTDADLDCLASAVVLLPARVEVMLVAPRPPIAPLDTLQGEAARALLDEWPEDERVSRMMQHFEGLSGECPRLYGVFSQIASSPNETRCASLVQGLRILDALGCTEAAHHAATMFAPGPGELRAFPIAIELSGTPLWSDDPSELVRLLWEHRDEPVQLAPR